ncbi:MAG: hypothetical protein AABM66_02835 [Actinomycetota bacterium]
MSGRPPRFFDATRGDGRVVVFYVLAERLESSLEYLASFRDGALLDIRELRKGAADQVGELHSGKTRLLTRGA